MLCKIPFFVRRYFNRGFEFDIPSYDKVIYLTFDDGPVPEVTPMVLELLERFDAKATFFCVGDNIKKHPDCFRLVVDKGHSVGNHTMHHLKGSAVGFDKYLSDVEDCNKLCGSKLFRPPYGKITRKQFKELKQRGFRIILWTVVSFDYSKKISRKTCLNNSLKLQSGDILLFHDSIKARSNMLYALEGVLKYYSAKGFRFLPIV